MQCKRIAIESAARSYHACQFAEKGDGCTACSLMRVPRAPECALCIQHDSSTPACFLIFVISNRHQDTMSRWLPRHELGAGSQGKSCISCAAGCGLVLPPGSMAESVQQIVTKLKAITATWGEFGTSLWESPPADSTLQIMRRAAETPCTASAHEMAELLEVILPVSGGLPFWGLAWRRLGPMRASPLKSALTPRADQSNIQFHTWA